MTSVNETNAITEYKKRLVEVVGRKKRWAINNPNLTSLEKQNNIHYNQALDDVLDLINSTN